MLPAPCRSYIQRCPIRVPELSDRLSAEEIIIGTQRFVGQYGR